ncbi:MAG: cell division protein ZapB [Vicinamibacteria bacterium]
MAEKRGSDGDSVSRFDELKKRVERATKLIAELRESNYALTAELAELQRKIGAQDAERAAPGAAAPAPVEPGVHEELQLLRDERKIIRAKVQGLLERIEKIDL